MDQHPTNLPPETEEKAHSIANTSTGSPLQANLHLPLTKRKLHTPPQTIQTEHPQVSFCQKMF